MHRSIREALLMALLAAALFGAVVPASRLLLDGIGPVTLAGILYLGAGIGGLIIRKIGNKRAADSESPIRKTDLPWLFGLIVTGSIIGPILCMTGLSTTPASNASLLLNAELAFTSLIAALAFHEHLGKRGICAIFSVFAGGLLLSYDPAGSFGLSTGSILIILACFCWSLDNNFTRIISGKEPAMIVMIKGFVAGTFSICLGHLIGEPIPHGNIIPVALLVGCFGYGFSIFLVIRSLRVLGSARTGALFATAPFIGLILSLPLSEDFPGLQVWLSIPLMAFGAWLIATEEHSHLHIHIPLRHEHRHSYDDGHHLHHHNHEGSKMEIEHAHLHIHEEVKHAHPHTPDIHHFHDHDDGNHPEHDHKSKNE